MSFMDPKKLSWNGNTSTPPAAEGQWIIPAAAAAAADLFINQLKLR